MTENSEAVAESYLSWLPVWSGLQWAGVLLVCLLVWGGLRAFWGRSLVRRRSGLWLLRGSALTIVGAILLGPTIVAEYASDVTRPTTFCLFDGSQSMQLGQAESRWQESLRFFEEARAAAGANHSRDCQLLRFGHRLGPLETQPNPPTGTTTESSSSAGAKETVAPDDSPALTQISTSGRDSTGPTAAASADSAIGPPDASDSRLGDALRQLLPQARARASAGVVLLSDGRVRGSESVERLAEVYQRAGIPLHVVPVGQAAGTGDIAVVSLVVPPRVRKHTENEIQIFFRSFGYAGDQTRVRVCSRNKIGDGELATLASTPVTLSGGAQSTSLTFRVEEQSEDLVVVIDPVEGELSRQNNRLQTRVEIDRTKVRVLCVEGDPAALQQQQMLYSRSRIFGSSEDSSGNPAEPLTVQAALEADVDVECRVLFHLGSGTLRSFDTSQPSAQNGFPQTRAELFAYDCVIFNNIGPDVLDEQQAQWLAQWIEGRGGGLIVTGSDALATVDWENSPLLPLLPVSWHRNSSGASAPDAVAVNVVRPRHPVWRLRSQQRLNDQLLSQLPSLKIGGMAPRPKTTAEVLAARADEGSPVLAAHRAGRGRVVVSTAALSGGGLESLATAWGSQPARVAAKFWRNLVYWATEGSSVGRRRLVAEADKRFYRPGDRLAIHATAYDEAARQTGRYRVWAMFEPASLDDMSLYSPILWPEDVVRESGEVGTRIAWGEELPLRQAPGGDGYQLDLTLSESGVSGDSEMRVQLTAYEGDETAASYGHGTQVDSTSMSLQVLSDPFEQQNPLPNRELLVRLASLSGGQVLDDPKQLANLLIDRPETRGPPRRDFSPAWSRWWLWGVLLGVLTAEWVWRRVTGLA